MSFLGVETSLTGRSWIGPGVEQARAGEHLAQETGLPPAVCQVLARRGVPAHEATGFLTPQLKELLPDPRRMKDMETAAARFLQAVERRERNSRRPKIWPPMHFSAAAASTPSGAPP